MKWKVLAVGDKYIVIIFVLFIVVAGIVSIISAVCQCLLGVILSNVIAIIISIWGCVREYNTERRIKNVEERDVITGGDTEE